MQEAINELNGKIQGITFNTNPFTRDSSRIVIEIYIGGANGDNVGLYTNRFDATTNQTYLGILEALAKLVLRRNLIAGTGKLEGRGRPFLA